MEWVIWKNTTALSDLRVFKQGNDVKQMILSNFDSHRQASEQTCFLGIFGAVNIHPFV